MNRFSKAAALAAFALAGCATIRKDTAATVYFTDPAGKQHSLTGELLKETTDSGVYVSWRHGIKVFIDGAVVAYGYLDPHNFRGVVTGKFNEWPAVASCTSRPAAAPGYHSVSCDVSIDGNKAGTLIF